MNFTIAAVATSIAGLILGLGWLFAGGLWFKRLGLEASASGLVIGRRLGAVYLGIAMMLFLVRSAPASEFRSSVCMAMIFALDMQTLKVAFIWMILGLFVYFLYSKKTSKLNN